MTFSAEGAWDAVHEALPARWCIGRPSFDPGALRAEGYRGAWSVTARGPYPGRGKTPQTVTGTGQDESAALRDLDDRLRGVEKPDGGRLERLRRRLRLAYLERAQDWARGELGRGLTADEPGRVIGQNEGRESSWTR